jgi:hypothetical protein
MLRRVAMNVDAEVGAISAVCHRLTSRRQTVHNRSIADTSDKSINTCQSATEAAASPQGAFPGKLSA